MTVNNSDNYTFLSKEALEELKKIHFEETGKLLTDEQAITLARDLFRLYRAVYGCNGK